MEKKFHYPVTRIVGHLWFLTPPQLHSEKATMWAQDLSEKIHFQPTVKQKLIKIALYLELLFCLQTIFQKYYVANISRNATFDVDDLLVDIHPNNLENNRSGKMEFEHNLLLNAPYL